MMQIYRKLNNEKCGAILNPATGTGSFIEDIYSNDVKVQLTRAFDMYKERAEKLENSDILINKGLNLIKKLEKDGFASASRLEFFCRKY